jgi:ADP-ribose pyrophosphatase YjhB (NUDIX family)
VGVGAIVVTADSRVVLVQRAAEPLRGAWSLPGGVLELGESVVDGIAREVREETGLDVDVGPLMDVFEHVSTDAGGQVDYHFVVLDHLCWARPGRAPVAGSDAAAVALVDPGELEPYALTPRAADVIARACGLAAGRPGANGR